ncbi:MAG: hypothetical protein KDC18_11710 [Alphaproteobacteria bacterium]|nr:hypothetical protein [Alphaproteobacteria bacterium]MCB9929504.1 hypothetical protein [Alphaproteobacteria bacterium]
MGSATIFTPQPIAAPARASLLQRLRERFGHWFAKPHSDQDAATIGNELRADVGLPPMVHTTEPFASWRP